MNLTPNKLTIAQLFATPNEQFVVPSYQRRYAWGFNQYCALYEDIEKLKGNDHQLIPAGLSLPNDKRYEE